MNIFDNEIRHSRNCCLMCERSEYPPYENYLECKRYKIKVNPDDEFDCFEEYKGG